jgi:hypothetical protein
MRLTSPSVAVVMTGIVPMQTKSESKSCTLVRYPKRKLPLNAEKWVQCCWAYGILQGPFLSSFLDIFLSSDLGCCLLMYTITALESAQEHVRKLSYVSPCMWWQSDMKLKKFLSIIESSLVYPVLYDSKRWVLCVFRSSLSSDKA